MRLYLRLVIGTLPRAGTARRDLLWGNLALGQKLAVCERQTSRPCLRQHDRVFSSALARSWDGWREALVFVEPDTVVRWHRTAWRFYWTWRSL